MNRKPVKMDPTLRAARAAYHSAKDLVTHLEGALEAARVTEREAGAKYQRAFDATPESRRFDRY